MRELKQFNTLRSLTKCDSQEKLDEVIETYMNAMEKTCEKTLKKIEERERSYKITSPKLTEIASMLKRLKKRMRRTTDSENYRNVEIYQQIQKEYSQELRKERKESWKKHCQTQNRDTVWSNLYRLIKLDIKAKDLTNITMYDNKIKDREEEIRNIKKEFFPEDKRAEDGDELARRQREVMTEELKTPDERLFNL